jgi:hypothetical protein
MEIKRIPPKQAKKDEIREKQKGKTDAQLTANDLREIQIQMAKDLGYLPKEG